MSFLRNYQHEISQNGWLDPCIQAGRVYYTLNRETSFTSCQNLDNRQELLVTGLVTAFIKLASPSYIFAGRHFRYFGFYTLSITAVHSALMINMTAASVYTQWQFLGEFPFKLQLNDFFQWGKQWTPTAFASKHRTAGLGGRNSIARL